MDIPLIIPKQRVQYSGVFDWDALYKFIVSWYKDRNFELAEKGYKVKPGGSEIEVTWEGSREETSYVRFKTITYVHIWDMHDVEIIDGGIKKKMTKARLSIDFSGQVELDWQNQYEKTKFLQGLRKFFRRFIFSDTTDAGYNWDKLFYHTLNLQTAVKEQLNLYAKYSAYKQTSY